MSGYRPDPGEDGEAQFEPLGYGNRWFDRLEARRRRSLLIVAAFAVVGMLVFAVEHTQIVLNELGRIAIGMSGALIFHLGMINQLSAVGRASKENGLFKNPIGKNRYHLIGLGLVVLGGTILAQPWPVSLALPLVISVGIVFAADIFLILKAIRIEDRGKR